MVKVFNPGVCTGDLFPARTPRTLISGIDARGAQAQAVRTGGPTIGGRRVLPQLARARLRIGSDVEVVEKRADGGTRLVALTDGRHGLRDPSALAGNGGAADEERLQKQAATYHGRATADCASHHCIC